MLKPFIKFQNCMSNSLRAILSFTYHYFPGNTKKKSVSCRPGETKKTHPAGREFFFFPEIF